MALRGHIKTSDAEWDTALNTPAADLPPLSAAEAKRAEAAGLDPFAFATSLYLRRLSEQRLTRQGERLGIEAAEALSALSPSFRVLQVVWEPAKTPGGQQYWTVRLALGREAVVDVTIDPLTAEAVADQLEPGLAELRIRVGEAAHARRSRRAGGAA